MSTGTIIATNSMMVDNQAGVLTKDLYEADYSSASGDSGGVVYASNHIIVGIHKGKDPARNNHTFAVKAPNICSELGVTMY